VLGKVFVVKKFTPRPYQPLMVQHLLSKPRCCLFAGMGTGKTAAVLTALVALALSEPVCALVLAPKRVAQSTWPDEQAKWSDFAGLKVIALFGSSAQRAKLLQDKADIYTINYEQLPWLVAHLGERWPFNIVIADESTRLKSFRLGGGAAGQRAKSIARVAHSRVKWWWNLTGTPSANGLIDLWGQMWFVDQGARLGRTFNAFTSRWFQPHPSGFGQIPTMVAQAQIESALKDICLTIDPRDWFDLKEPITTNIEVALPVRARALYRDMEKQMYAEIEGEAVEAPNAAARTLKCLQLANGAAYLEGGNTRWGEVHSEKLSVLAQIVAEHPDQPILVAYHFKSDLARIMAAFPNQAVQLGTAPAIVRAWNVGKIQMLVAHPASCGHGLNLQDGGNILVFFGHWWSAEERAQIIERIGPTRQAQAGHDRPVWVYNIVARDTVDEAVLARHEKKLSVTQALLDAMKHHTNEKSAT
jgi:SNF2 family DNA or RNA helicase